MLTQLQIQTIEERIQTCNLCSHSGNQCGECGLDCELLELSTNPKVFECRWELFDRIPLEGEDE
jgi:hypothetical protein